MNNTTTSQNYSRSSRIPYSLKAVFLASSQGCAVLEPPPDQLAARTFTRLFKGRKEDKKTSTSKPTIQEGGAILLDVPIRPLERGSCPQGTSDDIVRVRSKACKPIDDTRNSASLISNLPKSRNVTLRKPPPSMARSSSWSSRRAPTSPSQLSPQEFLDELLEQRGYRDTRYNALQTAYHNVPTRLQVSSYHPYLIGLVHSNNVSEIKHILDAGISPNPCNRYGESLLHLTCRLGHGRILDALLQAGSDVGVTDDFGRTPLHDACWSTTPCLTDVVGSLLDADPALIFLADKRGSRPLEYVPKIHWSLYVEFLTRNMDKFWPVLHGYDNSEMAALERLQSKPHTWPAPRPHRAMMIELAAMVTSGCMSPEEAQYLEYCDYIQEEEENEWEEENRRDHAPLNFACSIKQNDSYIIVDSDAEEEDSWAGGSDDLVFDNHRFTTNRYELECILKNLSLSSHWPTSTETRLSIIHSMADH